MRPQHLILLLLPLALPAAALAQPGMTPPGQVPPTSPVQPAPPEVQQQQGRGLLLGGSAGVGLREDGGFSGSLTVGMMMSPRLALIADGAVLASDCVFECSDAVESIGVLGVGARLFLGSRLWVQGTGGIAGMEHQTLGDDGGGLGWTAGGGFDLISGPRANLDLRLNFIGGLFENIGPVRAAFAVGITIK